MPAIAINGTALADPLTGTATDDIIYGLAGNDTLDGVDGNDYLNRGDGNDLLLGGAGNDTMDGGAGTDTLVGGAGDDTLIKYVSYYPAGIVTNYVPSAASYIYGGDGNDEIQISVGLSENLLSVPIFIVIDGGEGYDRISVPTNDGSNALNFKAAAVRNVEEIYLHQKNSASYAYYLSSPLISVRASPEDLVNIQKIQAKLLESRIFLAGEIFRKSNSRR